MNVRFCPNCKSDKNMSEFYSSKGKPSSYCKECCNNISETYYYAHHEEKLEYFRNKRKNESPNVKEKNRILRAKRLLLDCTQQVSACNKRAFEFGQPDKIKVEDWISMKKFYESKCLCCGKHEPEIVLTIDHIIPLTLGGNNTMDNIQPLCKSCNRKKMQKTTNYKPIPQFGTWFIDKFLNVI